MALNCVPIILNSHNKCSPIFYSKSLIFIHTFWWFGVIWTLPGKLRPSQVSEIYICICIINFDRKNDKNKYSYSNRSEYFFRNYDTICPFIIVKKYQVQNCRFRHQKRQETFHHCLTIFNTVDNDVFWLMLFAKWSVSELKSGN